MSKKIVYLALVSLLFSTPALGKTTSVPEFTRSLSLGLRGNDVKSLQEFLASDATIYPEASVTGYFGVKTQTAVKRWQQKHGIEAVGIVGPKTIAKIKETVQATTANTSENAITTPPQNTAATSVTPAQPSIANDTTLPTATLTIRPAAPTKVYILVNPSEEVTAIYEYGLDTNYGLTQPVGSQYFSSTTGIYIENLTSLTTYHVRTKITDRANNIGYSKNYIFTTPSLTQAPILSYGPSVAASTATPPTAVAISWETNIPCVGAVYYDATTAFGNVVRIDNTSTNHSATITGLSPGKNYLYKFTCATTSKTLESDNFIFTATGTASSIINNFSLASIIETLNSILEKMKLLIK